MNTFGGPGGISVRSAVAVELGAVHRLSDSDTEMSPSCHRIPVNMTEDLEEAGRLGGRVLWDAGGGYPVHVCAIPNLRPQRGVRGAQG